MKTRIKFSLKERKYFVQFAKYWFSSWDTVYEADFYVPAQLHKNSLDVAIQKCKEGLIVWE